MPEPSSQEGRYPLQFRYTVSIDKGFESKDNHRAKMLFAITIQKGLMRHARV